MNIIAVLMIFLGIEILFYLPVYIIWCLLPHKTLKQGLKDWIDESEDDI